MLSSEFWERRVECAKEAHGHWLRIMDQVTGRSRRIASARAREEQARIEWLTLELISAREQEQAKGGAEASNP